MSAATERLRGLGIGLRAVFSALTRDDASPAPSADASAGAGSTPTAVPTTRLCRKPMAAGFRCYELENHVGRCNPERIE